MIPAMDTSLEPLFVPSGDGRFTATSHTTGPWFPGAQHGGAPAALFMRQIELVDAPVPMAVTRLTMELFGPVPVGELHVTTTITRPGRRIQYVTAEMRHEDAPIAVASAWRIATGVDGGLPPTGTPPSVAPPDPEHFDEGPLGSEGDAFHRTAVQLINVEGAFQEPGPGKAWFRLLRPVVSGEAPSPAQRSAAVADFGNGIGSIVEASTHLFVNTDLTVSLGRPPVGEWILLEAETITGAAGHGFSTARMVDVRGQFGHATQSLLIAPR